MKNIIIFASGSGTNAENIIRYFESSDSARVSWVVSNKADAYALKRAETHNVKTLSFDKKDFYDSTEILDFLLCEKPDLIVLSGFMLLMPLNIVAAFPKRIINIHPALLPKYGGRGMYGDNVHKAVIANNEQQSGITVHYVNERYDEGDIIFQAVCPVLSNDTVSSLANRIHSLEYANFPKVIQSILEVN